VPVGVDVLLAAVRDHPVAVGPAGVARGDAALVDEAGRRRVRQVAHRARALAVQAHLSLEAGVAALAAVLEVGEDDRLAAVHVVAVAVAEAVVAALDPADTALAAHLRAKDVAAVLAAHAAVLRVGEDAGLAAVVAVAVAVVEAVLAPGHVA